VGLKAGRGLVPSGPSRSEPLNGLATSGVVSGTVRDTAAMLDVLAGPDAVSPSAPALPDRPLLDALDDPPGRPTLGGDQRGEESGMAAGDVTADGRARELSGGNAIPLLGFGVWQVKDGRECEDAVGWALEAGYRHIDTAQAYGNEASVGRALHDSGVPREDVFITTKFYPKRKDPEAEAQRSLERLGVDSVDLYIIHWPAGGPTWAWDGMQRAHERGYARSIGVSNFSVAELDALGEVAEIPPAANQVQFSPFEFRRDLLAACEQRGILIEAYSPLGTGRHLGDEAVAQIADRLGRTPAQVLIRWALQRDLVVLPKSSHQERIAENAQVFDFALADDDMAALDGLDETGGTAEAREGKWW
jgi:diketogulonate reductase-like aldo/keto reductase